MLISVNCFFDLAASWFFTVDGYIRSELEYNVGTSRVQTFLRCLALKKKKQINKVLEHKQGGETGWEHETMYRDLKVTHKTKWERNV